MAIFLPPVIILQKLQGNLIKRTNLEIPLAIFILTALVGVWAAYDNRGAWSKFWILLGGVLLYYIIVAQPASNWPAVGFAAGILGVVLALTLLLSFDWSLQPADYPFIHDLRTYLTNIKIPWIGSTITPNITAGILVVLLPLLLASTWSFLKSELRTLALASALISVFLIITLLMTSSRGAWIGLFIATTGSIGVLAFNRVRTSLPKINNAVIIMAVFLAGIAFVFGLWSAQDSLKQILQTITSGGSRITLLQQSYLLLDDFPIIGAGLQTFSGLYSRLILLLPVEIFRYAHNLYIDLALEQGIPGLLAFLFFLSGSLVISIESLVKPIDFKVQPFAIASFVGIVAMMFHGIFDDPIYGQAGTPLLFMAPGIAMAIYSSQVEAPHRTTLFTALRSDRLRKVMVPLAGILVLFLLLVIGTPKVQSIWSSNIGAVGMSKAELEDWPDVSWQGIDYQHDGLINARSAIERAIKLDSKNRAALYRMGLLAMNEGDFHRATDYLEIAFDLIPTHRGIIKSLGYSYLWSGRTPQAMSLLLQIPESRYELGVYSWWWETQGEMELASAAINMASALEESGAPLTSNPFVVEYSDRAGGSY